MLDFAKSIMCNAKAEVTKVGNSSHTKEEAKTKDEYFKILKFYQTQGYKTNAGEYNPNGRIKLHKGDDSVEIVLVGNSMVGNADPRIATFKAKIPGLIKQGDKGALKDIYRFADDMVKELSARKQKLYEEIRQIEKDEDGYIGIRSEIRFEI